MINSKEDISIVLPDYIFSSPRTGSTLMRQMLFAYGYAKGHYKADLGEFFHSELYFVYRQEVKDYFILKRNYEPGRFYIKPTLINGEVVMERVYDEIRNFDPAAETVHRIKLLESSPHRYLIHRQDNQIEQSAVAYLGNKIPLFVERRDTWHQILSWGLARFTGVYWATDCTPPVSVAPNSVCFDLDACRAICNRILFYRSEKIRHLPATVAIYEDHIRSGRYDELARLLDLPDLPEILTATTWFRNVQTPPSSNIFSNLDEVRSIHNTLLGNADVDQTNIELAPSSTMIANGKECVK